MYVPLDQSGSTPTPFSGTSSVKTETAAQITMTTETLGQNTERQLAADIITKCHPNGVYFRK